MRADSQTLESKQAWKVGCLKTIGAFANGLAVNASVRKVFEFIRENQLVNIRHRGCLTP